MSSSLSTPSAAAAAAAAAASTAEAAAAAAASSTAAAATADGARPSLPTFKVETSPNDSREYRGVVLPNQLKVVLVRDTQSDKAAAALDVNVGQFSDPAELPGLAHFCEHMLFLGTEKFPNENEYSEYLSKHGGYSNAFTDKENTDYHFVVSADNFEGALDRFAQFFIAPLFTASATERELNAVDSENSKNLQVDPWRLYQLLRTTSDESHPFSKFGTGNLQTLKHEPTEKGIDTRAELLAFHKRFYSANQMGLVLIGPQSLDVLEQWANDYFSPIENQDLEAPKYSGTPFGPSQVGRRRRIVPIKETNKLQLYFPLRSYVDRILEKPFTYLSSLFGHESEGSILHVLKERDWANSLSAGPSHQNRDFHMLVITIDLTERGLDHVDEIVDIVFQYADMLRLEGPCKRQFDEIAQVQDMHFRFQERSQPLDYAVHLACQLNKTPPELVISGSYLMRKWSPELINEIMDQIVPGNLILHQISKTYADVTPLTEKWYGTAYSDEEIDAATQRSWQHSDRTAILPSIHLPADNSFIPENFDLVAAESSGVEQEAAGALEVFGGVPHLIFNEAEMRLWYHQDTTFRVPKASINVRLISPVVSESPGSSVLAELFSRVVTEAMNAYSYFAEIAGLDFRISAGAFGVHACFSGYNDKIGVLAETMLGELRTHAATHQSPRDADVFHRVKAKYKHQLQNFANEAPYQHAMYNGDLALQSMRWDVKAKLAALDRLQPEDIAVFSKRFFNSIFVEMLIAGNVELEQAKTTGKKLLDIIDAIPAQADEVQAPRFVALPAGVSLRHQASEENPAQPCSAIDVYFQVGFNSGLTSEEYKAIAGVDAKSNQTAPIRAVPGTVSARVQAASEFLAHLIREPMYDLLRTKETLGYIVHAGTRNAWGVCGLRFLIQADKASPQYMDARVEAFIEHYRSEIQSLTQEEFDDNRAAFLTNLLEKPKNMSQLHSRFWAEILSRQFMFARRQLKADAIRRLTLQDVKDVFNAYIAHDGAERRKFSFHIYGNRSSEVFRLPTEDNGAVSAGSAGAEKDVGATDSSALPAEADSDGSGMPDPQPPHIATPVTEVRDLRRFVRCAPLFPSPAYTTLLGQAFSPP